MKERINQQSIRRNSDALETTPNKKEEEEEKMEIRQPLIDIGHLIVNRRQKDQNKSLG